MNFRYFSVILANIRVFLIMLLGFVLSVYLAWMANAQLGYGYDWLYDVYDTEQHIARFAPQNRYRKGFEFTQVSDHKAIFQKIVDSVHDDGLGLEFIRYSAKGKTYPVLHSAEIIHLQDVAILINKIHDLAIFCGFLLVALVGWHVMNRKKVGSIEASKKGLILTLIALILITVCLFLAAGAKAIFYKLHIWIFPQDHQWFFYYQDSLMSTLMKAPDLFAGIAIQILILALIIFTAVLLGVKKVRG
jgi:hypothetical protein